jgi:hypothetical protein
MRFHPLLSARDPLRKDHRQGPLGLTVGRKAIMKNRFAILLGVASIGLASVALASDPVDIYVSPSVLVLDSRTTSPITVHAEVKLSEVNTDTVQLNGIPAAAVFADARGELVAKFDIFAVKALAQESPELTLTLTAELKDGSEICGIDIVPVR